MFYYYYILGSNAIPVIRIEVPSDILNVEWRFHRILYGRDKLDKQ